MSSPTYLTYRIDEARREQERASARWQGLLARSETFAERCRAAGHPALAVVPPAARDGDAPVVDLRCDALLRQLATAASALEAGILSDRSAQITRNLRTALAALAERETAALAAISEPSSASEHESASADILAKVEAALISVLKPSTEIDAVAAAVIAADGTDHERVRMLLRVLTDRVDQANAQARHALTQSDDLAELRGRAQSLIDPDGVLALIEDGERLLTDGHDAGTAVARARQALDAQSRGERPERDRRFVLEALRESFTELGYQVTDVAVETAESIVLHRSSAADHGVQAVLQGDEIDMRTVRLSDDAGAAGEAADQRLCADIPEVRDRLSDRGVHSTVKRRIPPGRVQPQVVRTRSGAADSARTKTGRGSHASRERTAE